MTSSESDASMEEEDDEEEEDEEDTKKWVPLSERPEWADVRPVPQNDGPYPVVPILYTPQFRQTMDYFRAILALDEHSPRALHLTEEVIMLNAGNYTVWHFRRLILRDLLCDLWEELKFVERVAKSNHKNYQIWHHRRWTVENLGVAAMSSELRFTEEVFLKDAKNYHAWSHRQWVLRTFGGWKGELDFCDKLLQEDIYNNSAWNQRYYVISNSPDLGGIRAMRDMEVDYCRNAIALDSANESPWRYLKGLFKGDDEALVGNRAVVDIISRELQKSKQCIFALDLLLDILSLGFEPSPELISCLGLEQGTCSAFKMAMVICTHLKEIDSMRVLYWDWRLAALVDASVS